MQAQIDLVFLLDSSASIRAYNPSDGSYDNFVYMQSFLNSIVGRFEVSSDWLRVGMIDFSSTAYSYFYLNSYYTSSQIQSAILGAPYYNGQTNFAGAFNLARTDQFTSGRGDRSYAGNVVVMLTDGRSDIDTSQTITAANDLRNAGVYVIIVAITATGEVDVTEIASASDEYYLVDYWNYLYAFEDQVFTAVFNGATASTGTGSTGTDTAAGKTLQQNVCQLLGSWKNAHFKSRNCIHEPSDFSVDGQLSYRKCAMLNEYDLSGKEFDHIN